MLPLTLALSDDDTIKVIAISVGGGIALVYIMFGAVKEMVRSSNAEKSRRDIAAYVAEGSMSPDDGERLLNAGKGPTPRA